MRQTMVARPLRVGHFFEVAFQARQLALGGLTHLLPHPVGAVVQDDLHNPSI